jgi:hypothetical protein
MAESTHRALDPAGHRGAVDHPQVERGRGDVRDDRAIGLDLATVIGADGDGAPASHEDAIHVGSAFHGAAALLDAA